MCFSPQRRAIIRHRNVQKCSEDYSFLTFSLPNVLIATAAYDFSTSERPKVLRRLQFFHIFTSKCAFRHSGVQFFDGWRAKSASDLMCFVHFHFKMCFSPQRRTIIRHLNFKKCSETVSFLAFSLQNLLFATAACNFWCLLSAPTSAPAALTGLLLDWPDTRIYEKTQHFVSSLTFSADVSSFTWLWHSCIFCRLTWRLYCGAMHLVFDSTAELCILFSTLHIVGSFYLNFLRLTFSETHLLRQLSNSKQKLNSIYNNPSGPCCGVSQDIWALSWTLRVRVESNNCPFFLTLICINPRTPISYNFYLD